MRLISRSIWDGSIPLIEQRRPSAYNILDCKSGLVMISMSLVVGLALLSLTLSNVGPTAELLGAGSKTNTHRVYVNCNTGSDRKGDGTRTRPFLSPMHARNFLRTVASFIRAPVEVLVYGDCFPRNHKGSIDFSLPVLELEPGLDSGTELGPISYVGGKKSRFLSGLPINKQSWRQVNEDMYSVDLIALGAHPSWFGGFLQPDEPGGHSMGRCTSHQAELFFGGKPMTLARYPNKSPKGDTQWLTISAVNDKQSGFQVAVDAERVLSWAEAADPWIHGYWSYDWADSFLQVTRVANNTDTGATNVEVKGPVLYGFSKGAKFYGVNILSELDEPGEYYLDRSSGTLYFWPPGGFDTNEAFVSFGDYTVVLGGTSDALREAERRAEHGDAESLMETGMRAALNDVGGGVPAPISWSHGLHTAQQLDLVAESQDLRALDEATEAVRGKRGGSDRLGPRNPAATGWGSWDFWTQRRVLLRKSVLAHEARKVTDAKGKRADGVVARLGDGDGDGDDAALEYVNLLGFGIHFSQVAGVQVVNAKNVILERLSITNHGGLGIGLDGERISAARLEVGYTGCGALQLSGGETKCMGREVNKCVERGSTIRDADNIIELSEFHNFGRMCRTYQPGISWMGAGHTVRNSTVRDGPHAGILGRGNDCVFEHNVLQDLAFESTDTGGFQTGRSWVRRGNVLHGNTFRRIRNTQGMYLGYPQVMGIYLDDMQAGYTIVGNKFIDVQVGIYVGGGRDLAIVRNEFQHVEESCVRIDNRGMTWRHEICTASDIKTGLLLQQLEDVDYLRAPYATRYPALLSAPDIQPCKPTNIIVVHNEFCNTSDGIVHAPPGVLSDVLNDFKHNMLDAKSYSVSTRRWAPRGESLSIVDGKAENPRDYTVASKDKVVDPQAEQAAAAAEAQAKAAEEKRKKSEGKVVGMNAAQAKVQADAAGRRREEDQRKKKQEAEIAAAEATVQEQAQAQAAQEKKTEEERKKKEAEKIAAANVKAKAEDEAEAKRNEEQRQREEAEKRVAAEAMAKAEAEAKSSEKSRNGIRTYKRHTTAQGPSGLVQHAKWRRGRARKKGGAVASIARAHKQKGPQRSAVLRRLSDVVMKLKASLTQHRDLKMGRDWRVSAAAAAREIQSRTR
jgi:hypothetical protein